MCRKQSSFLVLANCVSREAYLRPELRDREVHGPRVGLGAHSNVNEASSGSLWGRARAPGARCVSLALTPGFVGWSGM